MPPEHLGDRSSSGIVFLPLQRDAEIALDAAGGRWVLEAIEALDQGLGLETVDQSSGGSDAPVELTGSGFTDVLPVLFGLGGGCFECEEGLGGGSAVPTAGVGVLGGALCLLEELKAGVAVSGGTSFGGQAPSPTRRGPSSPSHR